MITSAVTISIPHSSQLTRYPEGSFRELMTLVLPIMLSLLSGSLMGFCDRLFLSHYSLDALKAVSSANYLCILFQVVPMRVATMNQVYVSKHIGSDQKELAGAYTWQMIWFSLFSMLFTLPLSKLAAPLFFNHSEIAHLGKLYFFPLMYVNFLFPLGGVLAAFYIGKGKPLIVAAVTLMANLLNILLNYCLIFGIKGWIPSLGISGAAIATALSQTVYCAILFCLFLKEDKEYQTKDFSFKRKLFWNCIQTGVPRALGKMSTLIAWASGVALV
ncbi:MAG: polysaccharide biosynthesis C-terminal domain-containing protein, partial [Simkania negevensis]|nr:polysaccharide biosynthesis C-terminal domain-containing protein [Simkania negevensis]